MRKLSFILILCLFATLISSEFLQFTRETHVDLVLKQFHPALFYLMENNETIYQTEKVVEEVSNEVEGVLFFSSRRHHCEFFYKLHEFFGTYKVRDPVIVYFSSLGKKYLFEEDVITKEAVLEFIKKAQGGNLPVYYQNSELPENNTGPVYVYNAKKFKEELINSDQQYVVKFFAPWCLHSQDLQPKFFEMATKMAETHKDITFVEVDASANEISEVPIEAYPTIYFFKRDKNDAVVMFDGNREVEELINWVESLAQSLENPEESGNTEGTEEL